MVISLIARLSGRAR